MSNKSQISKINKIIPRVIDIVRVGLGGIELDDPPLESEGGPPPLQLWEDWVCTIETATEEPSLAKRGLGLSGPRDAFKGSFKSSKDSGRTRKWGKVTITKRTL
jgi:hypothetical protein